jgi:membrane-associated protein
MPDFNLMLTNLARDLGPGILLVLMGIAFTQTGLVLGPLIPGNTLFFTAGILSASGTGSLNWINVTLSLLAGALLGNIANYWQGAAFGRTLFERRQEGLISVQSLAKTEEFFGKHGRMTMLFSPFVPFIRSFAPFVAGMGRMPIPIYALFSSLGVTLWVVVLVSLGAGLGQIPWIKQNMGTFLVVMFVLVSGQLLIAARRSKKRD